MLLLVLYVSGVNGVSRALVRIVEMLYLLVLCVTGVNAVSRALVRIVEMCCYWFCMFQV